MQRKEILESILIIIEGRNAKYAENFRRTGMFIPSTDESVKLLTSLSQQLVSETEKNIFWNILAKPIRNPAIPSKLSKNMQLIYGVADQIFILFVKSDRVKDAIKYFEEYPSDDFRLSNVLRALNLLFKNESHHFTSNHLVKLENSLSKLLQRYLKIEKKGMMYTGSKQIFEHDDTNCEILLQDQLNKIKLLKLKILKDKLGGVNWEINQDKDKLKQRIKEFNFDSTLNRSLDKIDKELQRAEDEFDFKGCVDLIRTFFEQLVIIIANKIGEEAKGGSIGVIEKMGRARSYLRERAINFLSESQDELLGSFYKLASDRKSGTHSLTSDREHARLIRNMAIEIALFLMKRLDKYFDGAK